MWRIIAYILMVVGGVNWFMIGGLQYDFIAGIFGTQANIFSRIIYLCFGVASLYMLVVAVFTKGKIKLFGYKKNKPQREKDNEYF